MASLLFVFLLSVYGLANAIAVLKIGRFVFGTAAERKSLGRVPYLGDLFYCPPCLAFWIGLAESFFYLSPAAQLGVSSWPAHVLDGLMASGVVWILHLSAERLAHGLEL